MSNLDKKIETVDVKSLDKLSRILGAFDENLNFLSKELGVVAYVDGVKIKADTWYTLKNGEFTEV